MIFVSPEYGQYDRMYHVVNGFVKKSTTLQIAQEKLLDTNSDNTQTRKWRTSSEDWLKFMTATTFLDVRVIHVPIKTANAAVLAFGSPELLDKIKKMKLRSYRSTIEQYFRIRDIDWDQPLLKRKLTKENAGKSIGRTNLYRLLRGLPAEPTKGGNPESPLDFALYRYIRDEITETKFHYYIGLALKYHLETERFPNLLDVATEHSYLPYQQAPKPDVTVYTAETDYLLEFHFTNTPIAASQVATYTVNKVEQYMTNLTHLRSLFDEMSKKSNLT